jgi:hypothetical protein
MGKQHEISPEELAWRRRGAPGVFDRSNNKEAVGCSISREEDAIKCLHEVYWPTCEACRYSGPKGVN